MVVTAQSAAALTTAQALPRALLAVVQVATTTTMAMEVQVASTQVAVVAGMATTRTRRALTCVAATSRPPQRSEVFTLRSASCVGGGAGGGGREHTSRTGGLRSVRVRKLRAASANGHSRNTRAERIKRAPHGLLITHKPLSAIVSVQPPTCLRWLGTALHHTTRRRRCALMYNTLNTAQRRAQRPWVVAATLKKHGEGRSP